MQSIELKPKFDPYILNKSTDPQLQQLCAQLDGIFEAHVDPRNLPGAGFKSLSREKEHILTHIRLPGWIIKAPRHDRYNCCEDQHIYRVRKMRRVQKVIEKYNMTEVVAPKKYLYEFKGEWFVIAEKMDLESVKIDNVFWEREIPEDQLRPLTPQQAKELAIICYEAGLPDMGPHNLGYLTSGEVCPFDSEPLTRGLKKKWKRFPIPGLSIAIDYFLAKANADRLHRICHDPDAQKEVEKVQKQMLIKHVAKLIGLAALPLFGTLGMLWVAPASFPLIAFIKGACVLTSLNTASSLALLGFSLFSDYIIGPFEYEGDLIEKYS